MAKMNMLQTLLPPSTAGSEVAFQQKDNPSLTKSIDIVFPVLHGPLCEDGAIQGMLETAGVAYVGAGVLGSAIGMDKDVAKRLAKEAGIPVVPSRTYRRRDWNRISKTEITAIEKELGLPLFVKPVNMGSSVGVSRVTKIEDLQKSVSDAFHYDEKVLIETAIDAREVEIAALESLDENEGVKISVPGEIIPQHEFYSYDAKYLDENGAALKIPAEMDSKKLAELNEMARSIFDVLECSGMARIDFFLEKKTNKIYLNEINTLPGFTSISMYPKLWEASGLSYENLLTHLIDLALQRFERRKNISREYLDLK